MLMIQRTRTFLKNISWEHNIKAVVFLGLLLIGNLGAYASSVPAIQTKASLIAEESTVQPGRPFWIALRLVMGEGWHTYWRNPGDAGLATSISWDLPQGFVAGEPLWPYPHKIAASSITSFGYEGEVCLLVQITPTHAITSGSSITIKAVVNWLECQDACRPGEAELNLELPLSEGTPQKNNQWQKQFSSSRSSLPLLSSAWQLSASSNNNEFELLLTAVVENADWPDQLFFYPEQGDLIDHAAVQTIEKNRGGLLLRLKKSPYLLEQPKRLKGVLVSPSAWLKKHSAHALQVDVEIRP